MLHTTKAIVLRSVKYGETSLIVTAYTERFGLQSYIVSGVRSAAARSTGRANVFQPAALLEMVVYHQELKNLHRVREFRFSYLYEDLFFSVTKHAVALFMIELLLKGIRQPEAHEALFGFLEQSFLALDTSADSVVANFSIYFSLHLARYLGCRIQHTEAKSPSAYLDLQEGLFVSEQPPHGMYLEGALSEVSARMLETQRFSEIGGIPMNRALRQELLKALELFYAWHIEDFGTLRTLPVLQAVFE